MIISVLWYFLKIKLTILVVNNMTEVLLSIDQSLTHTACVVWHNNKPVHKVVLRTQSTSAKEKKPGAVSFATAAERIDWICKQVRYYIHTHHVDTVVMEGLSFGSRGDATRELAGLFYGLEIMLWDALADCENDGLFKVYTVTPTTAKKFARSHLPEGLAFEEQKKLDKKTGKEHTVKKPVTMDKKLMVKACDYAEPGFLDDYNLTKGKADLADAYWIGRSHLEGLSQSVK